ncbi:MAG: heterodisulfide reductase-related iron-sulfur binding cluster [Methanomassiliicoccaceae archaeon]|nr:heterodisulfide reductase-related iron-sulfur binding cluster [Methanomassiliicoccaceae archaeon]
MNDIVLYPGCLIQSRLPFLEAAARFILDKLNVKADDIEGFTCCMEPVGLRSLGPETWKGVCARIHSIAFGNRILTLCDGCNMSLSEAGKELSTEHGRRSVSDVMKEIGREVNVAEVTGLLEFLHSNLETIKKKTVTKMDFDLAVFPGCHCEAACKMKGLSATGMLSDIVRALGGNAISIKKNLCCGGGLAGVDAELEKKVMQEAISSAKDAGAIAVVTSCPFCFLQFDMVGRQTTLHIAELVASGMGWEEDAHRHHRTK